MLGGGARGLHVANPEGGRSVRWSSARIAWALMVGIAGFMLLASLLAGIVRRVPTGFDWLYHGWTKAVRVQVPFEPCVAVLAVLAAGLATGVLPDGAWPAWQLRPEDPGDRRTARRKALRRFGVVFVIAVLFALLLLTAPEGHRKVDLRPPVVSAFEVAVVSGAALTWIALGAHRGAAIFTVLVFALVAAGIALWSPWWKRFDFSLLVGPYFAVHVVFSVLLATTPIAFLMMLSARLRLASWLRLTPGLAVVFVSGMFVICGYLGTFAAQGNVFRMSRTASGHR